MPVHMVVGGADTSTEEINNPGESNWMDGAELTGRTRIERLLTLRDNYESLGMDVSLDILEGVGHDGSKALPAVEAFFTEQIAAGRHVL